jgi:hypothetical protein
MRVEALIKATNPLAPRPEEIINKIRIAFARHSPNLGLIRVVIESVEEDEGLIHWAMLRADLLGGGRIIIEARGDNYGEAIGKGIDRLKNSINKEMLRRWIFIVPPRPITL